MVEDVARTVHLAREAGPLVPIPQDAIDRLYDRYQNVYGQSGDTRRVPTDSTSEATTEKADA
jgi:L-ribulose-5-phosphate 4-epimerase